MKDGLDLNDLRLFYHVVECGGFSAASKILSVPTSTISQRIAMLERTVGVGLLRRTTRSLSLTEAGQRMLEHARAIDEQACDAQRELAQLTDELSGGLRVTTSVAVAQFALAPILPKFQRQYPDISVCVEATNRYIDIVSEGFDVGIRAHGSTLKDSSLVQRVVARTTWTLAASPGFLQENDAPAEPAGLAMARVLYFGPASSERMWSFQRDNCLVHVSLKPSMCLDDMSMLRTAAVGGAGIIALPTYIIDSELKQGALTPVLPEWRLAPSLISIITPPRRQSSRLTRCFTDFVAAEFPGITNAFGSSTVDVPM